MENYQKELTYIKQVLKENPKGMTVTDIARKINVNRNSVAKYLDILLISGHAEMIAFGPAKVYFPSRRVPLPTLLNFSSDYILVLNRDLMIVQINDSFLDFMHADRDNILGQRIEGSSLPIFDNPEIQTSIREVLDEKSPTKEAIFHLDDIDLYFRIKIMPTTFEDGEHGIAVILTNITEQKRIEHALRASEDKFKELFEEIRKIKKEKKTK